MCNVVNLRTTTPLFKAYEEVYTILETKYCPSFFKSEEVVNSRFQNFTKKTNLSKLSSTLPICWEREKMPLKDLKSSHPGKRIVMKDSCFSLKFCTLFFLYPTLIH